MNIFGYLQLMSLFYFFVISQLRRERFVEDLESYAKQVEEFQYYGDMSEIVRYLKKAQALDAKLQAAADKVKFVFIFPFENP